MTSNLNLKLLVLSPLLLSALTACTNANWAANPSSGRPKLLKIVDPNATSSSVSASVYVGNVYLDYQLAPVSVGGLQLQASDVAVNSGNIYVSYNAFDTNGVVIKKGAVELVKLYSCDSASTLFTDYCLQASTTVEFPTTDIFAAHSDGTNLYAVGSTSDTTDPTYFGRLFKIGLDGSKAPTSVSNTQVLQSYAGTGVVTSGSNLLVTYGTSVSASLMGGFGSFNPSTLALNGKQDLYDARSVAADPSSSANAFVLRGPDGSNQSAVYKYATTGLTSSPAPLAVVGGNTAPESKSTVVVGNSLILTSTGDGGFKVLCKATGATVASMPAITVAGIPAAKTVTNSLAAIPGYIFTANGEGGVNVYSFKRSNVLNGSYCQTLNVASLGRLKLDTDDNDGTYVNAELSANSVKSLTITNVLNVVTSRLIVVASGNKGISLLDMTGLNVAVADVDDF